MSRSSHWILVLLALSCSGLAATAFILYEINAGLHFSFVNTLIVSALVGVMLPVLCVVLFRRLGWMNRVLPAYLLYMLVCV
ncbi:MAG: hypothetical protein AAF438_14260, partial [Pseudomonadota bacterium]